MPESANLPVSPAARCFHPPVHGRSHDITSPTGGTTAEANNTFGHVSQPGSLFITCLPPLVQCDVPLKAGHFLRIDILSDFAAKLLDVLIRAILFELAQHSIAEAGNAQDVLIGSRVEVD